MVLVLLKGNGNVFVVQPLYCSCLELGAVGKRAHVCFPALHRPAVSMLLPGLGFQIEYVSGRPTLKRDQSEE